MPLLLKKVKMKYSLIVIFSMVAIATLFSCSDKQVVSPQQFQELPAPKGAREDDDRPFVMRVSNSQDAGLSNASVTMVSNSDTLYEVTDSIGYCRAQLLRTGNWHVHIELQGYTTLDTLLYYESTNSIKSIVLQQ